MANSEEISDAFKTGEFCTGTFGGRALPYDFWMGNTAGEVIGLFLGAAHNIAIKYTDDKVHRKLMKGFFFGRNKQMEEAGILNKIGMADEALNNIELFLEKNVIMHDTDNCMMHPKDEAAEIMNFIQESNYDVDMEKLRDNLADAKARIDDVRRDFDLSINREYMKIKSGYSGHVKYSSERIAKVRKVADELVHRTNHGAFKSSQINFLKSYDELPAKGKIGHIYTNSTMDQLKMGARYPYALQFLNSGYITSSRAETKKSE
jgi:hypothetical protein